MCEAKCTGSLGRWPDFIVQSQHHANTQTYIGFRHLLRWPYPCANGRFGPQPCCPVPSSSLLDPFLSSVFFPPPHSNPHLLMSLVTWPLSDLWLWASALPKVLLMEVFSCTKSVPAPVYNDDVLRPGSWAPWVVTLGTFLTSHVTAWHIASACCGVRGWGSQKRPKLLKISGLRQQWKNSSNWENIKCFVKSGAWGAILWVVACSNTKILSISQN